jgi:hypothetical protein
MLDPRGNSQTLLAFHFLVEEQLATLPFGGLAEIQTIYDVQSLVAYLGHHFHLSFELLLLTTPDEMLPLFNDEVRESAESVEFICDRIGIMKCGSESRASWMKAKDHALRQADSISQRLPGHRMRDIMNDVGEKLTKELAAQFPGSTVYIFLHLHMIRITVTVTGCNDMLHEDNVNSYVSSFYGMPDKCLSENYMATASVVQGLLLKSLSQTLSDDEIRTVYRQSVWQALHFIDHFKTPEREMVSAPSSFEVVCPTTEGYVLGVNEGSNDQETEKADMPEHSKKDEDLEKSTCLNVSPHSDQDPMEELKRLDREIQDLIDAVSNPQLPSIITVELESALEEKQTFRKELLQSLQPKGAQKVLVLQSSALDSQTLSQYLMMTLRHVRPVMSSLCQVMLVSLPYLPRSQLCVVCEHLAIHDVATRSDEYLIGEIEQRMS